MVESLNGCVSVAYGIRDFREGNLVLFMNSCNIFSFSYRVPFLRDKFKPNGSVAFFVDPPYSSVGERLYTYGRVDHDRLFSAAAKLPGRVLMRYHNTSEIRRLAAKIRAASVSGYQRESIPLSSSPRLNKPAPGARIPPWFTRFRSRVFQARA